MFSNALELVVTNLNELMLARELYRYYKFSKLYITPNLLMEAGVMRHTDSCRFKIIVMVDYPDGLVQGVNKFRGVDNNFFNADGYDIIVGHNDVRTEIKEIHKFIRNMINQHAEIGYTFNIANRTDDNIKLHINTIIQFPPNFIKMNAQTNLPKAVDRSMHKDKLELINSLIPYPVVVCGNVEPKICEILSATLACSPKQMKNILDKFSKKDK